ncbi:MAG TPA: hypothetical protein VFZ26_18715 [Gemmatimonadales bacterium]
MSGPPPFRLPGTHFVGAMVWLVLGGIGLVAVAPDLAAGRMLAPRVLGVTHLYTLGVILASVFGALYQFYPMSLGAGARSVRAGIAGAWLLHLGVALLVVGLWRSSPALQAAGWWVLFGSVGCVSWNLLPHRRRMTQGRRAAAYVSAAHSMLGFAMLLAGARIGEGLGWWTVDRLGAIAAHFHLAAFGFAGLTAVGVGGRMLPMFLVSGAGPEWPLRIIGPAAVVGLLLLGVGLLFGLPGAVWPGALLGVGAAALFVGMVAGFFRRRLVRVLEPAFGHVLAGFVSLALALAAGVVQLASPGVSLRGWIVYAELTLLGWLVLFITGVWYRLVPFLIWLHFYGRGGGPVTPATELVHRGTAWAALGLLAGGTALLIVGTALASPISARAGAAGVLAGSLLVAGQYVRIYSGRGSGAGT